MASKRQRKKNAKKLGTWETQQYRGGRVAGKKNLKKVPGGLQNQYGVTFTKEQKRALERAVDRSNYRRKKQLAEADKLNPNHSQLRLMGKESDFIITRQSKSLQRFKSLEEYEQFMDKQARIQSGEYLEDRTRLYKSNYMKAIDNVFGEAGKGVKMKVRMMKPEKFRELVETLGDEMEIGYIYDPQARMGKLNKIRALLGMRELEEDPFLEE
jgi:hypothetical protein